MYKLKQKESGFSTVEVLLIIVIFGIIGGVGWFVWNNRANDKSNSTATNTTTKSTATTQSTKPTDPTAKWQVVTTTKRAFSIKIPDGWTINNVLDSDELMTTTNSADLVYAAGKPAVIQSKSIVGTDAPIRYQLFVSNDNKQGWTDTNATKTDFTTNGGIMGVRYYQLYSTASESGIGPEAGEKAYEYFLNSNGKYYHLAYRILPGDSDNLVVVEQSLKTLTVN